MCVYAVSFTFYSLERFSLLAYNEPESVSIARPGLVTPELFDIAGRQVRVLEQGHKQAGRYGYTLDAGGLSSGVYMVSLNSGRNNYRQKIVCIK